MISIVTPSYGRPELVSGVVGSFLAQDYTGEKELVICNDYKRIKLVLDQDYPGVKIYNVKKRFGSLAEKEDWIGQCTRGDIMRFDDDDIMMPWALSLVAKELETHETVFADCHWQLVKGDKLYWKIKVEPNGSAYRRETWKRHRRRGGITNMGGLVAQQRFADMGVLHVKKLDPKETYVLTRVGFSIYNSSIKHRQNWSKIGRLVRRHELHRGEYVIKPEDINPYIRTVKDCKRCI